VKLVFTRLARTDLVRLREFIGARNPEAAGKASDRIKAAVKRIEEHPLLGRPITTPEGERRDDLREVIIPFGARGYLLRYQVLPDQIRILRIWHAREGRE